MVYRILVFTQKSILSIPQEVIQDDLLKVNFHSLGEQYGLDPSQVEAAKSNLEVHMSRDGKFPYFFIRYNQEQMRPIVVHEWELVSDKGKKILGDLLQIIDDAEVIKRLPGFNYLMEIELAPSQLKDMGLLLAYEIARWAAAQGVGLVLGLDKIWYRLNRHKAFIPINGKNI